MGSSSCEIKRRPEEGRRKIYMGESSPAAAVWGLTFFAHTGYEMNGFISAVFPFCHHFELSCPKTTPAGSILLQHTIIGANQDGLDSPKQHLLHRHVGNTLK